MKDSLEEAAERYWAKQPYNEDAFIEGAKWQAKKMYSEDDLRQAHFEGKLKKQPFDVWFKQFKK